MSSNMVFEMVQEIAPEAVIKVIGVGGGGCNAVDNMIESQVKGVEFIAANTDAQALRRNRAPVQIQIGQTLTKGLGAGANPDVGRSAAIEDRDRIAEVLRGAHENACPNQAKRFYWRIQFFSAAADCDGDAS